MSVHRMLWDDLMPHGGLVHVARYSVTGRRPGRFHCHDFAEVFWISEGHMDQLLPGRRLPMERGDLYLVRPEHAHDFQQAPNVEAVMTNIAFPARILEDLALRHADEQAGWEWSPVDEPVHYRIDRAGLDRLDGWAYDLVTGVSSRLDVECFLLDVLRVVRASAGAGRLPAAPAWLGEALRDFDKPALLARGLDAFVELCGRSASHVNRVVNEHFGKSATDLVNQLRLDHAAKELAMGDRKIAAIALDVGIDNLGYFYRLFRKRFGTTPRQYRLSRLRVVGTV